MRRYWLTIVLVPFIVLCIGTYYIQAESRYPEFVLQKQEGDEKEAAFVLLRGQYGENSRPETVTIGSQGSEYDGERSFFARIAPYWGSEEVKKLAEEHRNFMRGKREPFSFYEDDDLLVYANVKGDDFGKQLKNARFSVSLLDKKTGRSSSYEVGVPNGNLYNWIYVYDVQVVGDQVKVVTQNNDANSRSEIHLYSFGLRNGEAPADQILFREQESENMKTNIGGGFEENAVRPSRYIVFHAIQLKQAQGGQSGYGGYPMEEAGAQLLVFDIQTGQEVKIESREINDLLRDGTRHAFSLSLQGDNIFLANKSGEGVRVIRYNIPEAKTTVNDVGIDSVVHTTLKNGRLYMLIGKNMGRQELPSLAVADASTGKLLYKGTISLKGTEPDRTDALRKLFVYDLLVSPNRQ